MTDGERGDRQPASTGTGRVRLVVVPSPRAPKALSPRHRTWPVALEGAGVLLAGDYAVMPVSGPVPASFDTVTGPERGVVEPSPSWPWSLPPQQRTSPPETST